MLILQRTFSIRNLLERELSVMQLETGQSWVSDPTPWILHKLRAQCDSPANFRKDARCSHSSRDVWEKYEQSRTEKTLSFRQAGHLFRKFMGDEETNLVKIMGRDLEAVNSPRCTGRESASRWIRHRGLGRYQSSASIWSRPLPFRIAAAALGRRCECRS